MKFETPDPLHPAERTHVEMVRHDIAGTGSKRDEEAQTAMDYLEAGIVRLRRRVDRLLDVESAARRIAENFNDAGNWKNGDHYREWGAWIRALRVALEID